MKEDGLKEWLESQTRALEDLNETLKSVHETLKELLTCVCGPKEM